MTDEVIVRAYVGSDGNILFDVFLDPKSVELPDESDDGGECTSGEDKPDEPHNAADWKAALEMATSQSVDLIERKADHERRNA